MSPASADAFRVDDLKTPSLLQRKIETALLEESLASIDGSGLRFVLLVGPEGMGKTALIQDFLERHFPDRANEDKKTGRRDAGADSVVELDCRALNRNHFSPILALVSRLHSRFGRTTSESGPGSGGSLDMDTIEFTIGQLDAEGSQNHFATITSDEQAVFRGLGEFIARHGRKRRIVIVLENLQDIGSNSAEFLDSFLRSGLFSNTRILIVAAYRGDNHVGENEFQKLLPRLRRLELFRESVLSPLKPAAITTLFEETIGPIEELRRPVHAVREATGGNPLQIRELLQVLARRGKIVRSGEAWRIEAAAEDLAALPEAMESRLIEKIPKLGKVHLEVLRWAAVARRPVTNRFLQDVAGLAPNQLVYLWTDLLKEQYLRERKTLQLAAYDFASSRVRQKIYEDLPEKERKKRHLAVAKALETIHADLLAPVSPDLVEHYALGDNPKKEKSCAFLAGDHHLASGDAASAARMYERALELVGPKGNRSERRTALLALGHARLALDQPEAARKQFETAKNESKGSEVVDCLIGIGETWLTERRLEKAVQCFEEGKRHLERKDSPIEVEVSLATVSLEKNLFTRALDTLASHPAPPASASPRTAARFHLVRGIARERTGEIAKGLADLEECRKRLEGAPDSSLWARSSLETLRILVECGRIGDAGRHYESIEDRLEAMETRLLGFHRRIDLAALSLARGDLPLAHERASEARKLAQDGLSDRDRALAELEIGLVLVQAKKLEAAQKYLRAAESGFDQLGDAWGKARVAVGNARLAARADKSDVALRMYGEALGALRSQGTKTAQVRTLIEKATLVVRAARLDEAEGLLAEALREAREVGDPGAEALALREEGIRLAAGKSHGPAQEALEASLEKFQELGYEAEAKRSAAYLEKVARKSEKRERP